MRQVETQHPKWLNSYPLSSSWQLWQVLSVANLKAKLVRRRNRGLYREAFKQAQQLLSPLFQHLDYLKFRRSSCKN